LEKGIFQCFGCGAKGNLLEFAALMEKVDPKDGTAFRKVAGELQKKFCPELSGNPTRAKNQAAQKPETPAQVQPKIELPVVVNQPLDFDLKGLDASHPYLLKRGFSPDTIAELIDATILADEQRQRRMRRGDTNAPRVVGCAGMKNKPEEQQPPKGGGDNSTMP